MRLIIATGNKHKVREIKEILKDVDVEVGCLKDISCAPRVKEDRRTLRGNAVKKALAVARITDALVMADDSGLEVDALNGRPGVSSSRFAGEDVTYSQNNAKLLRLLEGVPMSRRKARFRCFIALAHKGRLIGTAEGVCSGYISKTKRGRGGFGYDPLFVIPRYKKTFAQLGPRIKNGLSHRARALRKARGLILRFLRTSP